MRSTLTADETLNRAATARRTALAILVTGLATVLNGAGIPDINDGFENPPYPLGQTFVTPVGGWTASSLGVMVTNDFKHAGNQSVVLPENTSLTNAVVVSGTNIVWTDCWVLPCKGIEPDDPETNVSSFVAYFSSNGYLTVATPAGWQTCSNDVWGGPVDPILAGAFAHISVYQDFAVSNSAVFVNGQLVLQDLRFVGSAGSYARFAADNVSSNAWLDDVWIKPVYPASLTQDRNGVYGVDALEVQTYGYAARTLTVGPTGAYPTLAGAMAVARSRDSLQVSGGAYTGDLFLNANLSFTGGGFTNDGHVVLGDAATIGIQPDLTCSNLIVGTNAVGTFGGAVTCSNLLAYRGARVTVAGAVGVAADLIAGDTVTLRFSNTVSCGLGFTAGTGATVRCEGAVTCGDGLALGEGATGVFLGAVTAAGAISAGTNAILTFSQPAASSNVLIRAGASVVFDGLACSNLIVEAGASVRVLGAFLCAGDVSVDAGATVGFSNTVACSGGFAVAAGATVAFARGATLGTLDSAGTLAVGNGQALTLDAATVYGAVQANSSTVTVSTLNVPAGGAGSLSFVGGRLIVAPVLIDMTGTFIIDTNWGTTATLGLTFHDDFDAYAAGTLVTNLGFRGWGSPETYSVVTAAKDHTSGSGHSVHMSDESLISNRIATAAVKIWTDCYMIPHPGEAPVDATTGTSSFVSYVDTNGWLVVATNKGWLVCSNYYDLTAPVAMTNDSFARVTVHQDFSTHLFALFIDGRLVTASQPFPSGTAVSSYNRLVVDNRSGEAYVDDVLIGTNLPPGLDDADLNANGVPDGTEIHQAGRLLNPPWMGSGSVFRFR